MGHVVLLDWDGRLFCLIGDNGMTLLDGLSSTYFCLSTTKGDEQVVWSEENLEQVALRRSVVSAEGLASEKSLETVSKLASRELSSFLVFFEDLRVEVRSGWVPSVILNGNERPREDGW